MLHFFGSIIDPQDKALLSLIVFSALGVVVNCNAVTRQGTIANMGTLLLELSAQSTQKQPEQFDVVIKA